MNKKQSPFVKSNFDRRKNDHYPTFDKRCVHAIMEAMDTITSPIVDVCAPTSSGIIDELVAMGYEAYGIRNCFEALPRYTSWVVTNTPYKKDEVGKIIEAQIERIRLREVYGVACLLRTGFDHAKIYAPLFDSPYYFGQVKMRFRPIWVKPKKLKPGEKRIGPIHNFVWHVWTLDKQVFPRVMYWTPAPAPRMPVQASYKAKE